MLAGGFRNDPIYFTHWAKYIGRIFKPSASETAHKNHIPFHKKPPFKAFYRIKWISVRGLQVDADLLNRSNFGEYYGFYTFNGSYHMGFSYGRNGYVYF